MKPDSPVSAPRRAAARTPARSTALLAQLAPRHADALRLAARGARTATIAERLGIPEESVAALLEIAAAKLARLRGEGDPQ